MDAATDAGWSSGSAGRLDARNADAVRASGGAWHKSVLYAKRKWPRPQRQALARRANPAPARPGDVGGDNEAFVDGDYTYLPDASDVDRGRSAGRENSGDDEP